MVSGCGQSLPVDGSGSTIAVSCDPALVLVDVISALRLMLPVVSCELVPSGHCSTAPCSDVEICWQKIICALIGTIPPVMSLYLIMMYPPSLIAACSLVLVVWHHHPLSP